jgi:hypothetical protein
VPPEFAQTFVEGGWRKVERAYGSGDERFFQWMELVGGYESMKERRREYLRERIAEARAKIADERQSHGIALAAVSRRRLLG